MKRIKPTPIKTRAEMELLVGQIADLKITETKLANQLDTELKATRDGYETEFAALDDLISAKMALAEQWATAHPEEFGKLKSIEFVHGTAGLRVGMPKLKCLARWTKEKVLAAMVGLIGDRAALEGKPLTEIGLRVEQDETFYVEPKLTPVENRETTEKK